MGRWSCAMSLGLRDLLKAGEETDFVLTCTDGSLRCHKVVLLAAGGKLSSQVRERLADKVSRLDLTRLDLPRSVATQILLALYGGMDNELLSEKNLSYFVHFAVHFDIEWLMTELIDMFAIVLSPQNALNLYKHPEIHNSTHMARSTEDYCSRNFAAIVEEADFSLSSLDGILMVAKLANSQKKFNCFKLFEKTFSWLLSDEDHLKSAATVLSLVPLKPIPKSKLQFEVYDMIFNKLVIGRGDKIPQEDKVLLSSLYQEAARSVDELDGREIEPNKEGGVEQKTEPRKDSGKDVQVMKKGRGSESEDAAKNSPPHEVDDVITSNKKQNAPSQITPRSILSYMQNREWSNLELHQIQKVVEREDLPDCTEFLIVESVLVWIAADPYRKQHCEQLLRSCRFSALCPVYIRSVLTTFITEKMVGSVRLANNILRSPSSPRPDSVPGRLAGVCDDIPLSVQRLQLGAHSLSVKCSCGSGGEATLSVSKNLPTASVKELNCRVCGVHRVIHTACASTLTPDLFPSMYLLPFNHLARLLSSMDDIRIYFFK